MTVAESSTSGRMQAKAHANRSDLISQYLALLQQYHEKSVSAQHDHSCYVDITSDIRRVYLPGSRLDARISVPSSTLGSGSGDEGFSEVLVEFKGEARSYGKAYDGQGSATFETLPLFSYTVSLWRAPSSSSDSPKSSEDIEVSAPKTDQSVGMTSWDISTDFPTKVTIKTEQGPRSLDLPSTFKDRFSDPSNHIVYCVKVTGIRPGLLRKSVRKWLPLLLVPVTIGPVPKLTLRSSPGLTGDVLHPVAIPEGWVTSSHTQKFKKGLVFEGEKVDISFSIPETRNVAHDTCLPFVIAVTVSSKEESDFGPAGSVRLPILPLDGEGNFVGPSLDLRRIDDSQAATATSIWGSNEQTTSLHPCEVEWNRSHLEQGAGEPEPFDIGQGWSKPTLVDEGPPADGKGKGKLFSLGRNKTTARWVRTAVVSGRLRAQVSPTIALPNIRVSYQLALYWGLEALAATIQYDIGPWTAATGITVAALDFPTDELTAKIAGPRLDQLLQTGPDGVVNQLGANRHPEAASFVSSVGLHTVVESSGSATPTNGSGWGDGKAKSFTSSNWTVTD